MNFERLCKVYEGMVRTAYQGLGFEAQKEERDIIIDMICEECGCTKEDFEEMFNNLIYQPCMDAYNIHDWELRGEVHDKIMNTRFPILFTVIQEGK